MGALAASRRTVGEPLCGLPRRVDDVAGGRRIGVLGVFRDMTGMESTEEPSRLRQEPRRKQIRLAREVYARSGQPFFITVSAAGRQSIFANPRYARATFDSLLRGPLFCEAQCLAACLMPDHLHLLVIAKQTNIINLLDRWKSFTTNLLHGMGLRGLVWQRSFHDHALRREEAMRQVAEYIINNPVRRGLVAEWQDYPYSWAEWVSGDR